MWAPKGWREHPGLVWLTGRPEPLWSDDVRVLVEEIPEGRPEFRPGDRVKTRMGTDATVLHCFKSGGTWWVAITLADDAPGTAPLVRSPANLRPVPRETSRLIRVTGPEDEVGAVVKGVTSWNETYRHKVRVEVVDE